MLKLYEASTLEGQLIALMLITKGVTFKAFDEKYELGPTTAQAPTLVDKHLQISGVLILAHYIERRYPCPALMPNDPGKSAIVQMLTTTLISPEPKSQQKDLREYRLHVNTNGFINKGYPTLADLALLIRRPPNTATDTFWERYTNRVLDALGTMRKDEGVYV